MFLVPSPTGYPSQQYSSSQLPPTTSRQSTFPTTPTYDHAPLSTHPPAPPPLSGSTSYNPSFPQFPVPDVPVRHPSTNHSGPAPVLHRATTMPMAIHPNPSSSVPYDTQPPNAMQFPSQPTAHGWSYLDVHDRDDGSSTFSDEDLEQRQEGTRHSGEYIGVRSPPNFFAAGMQDGRHGHRPRQFQPPPPERLRCRICGRVSTRFEAERRNWNCTGGHTGRWERYP